MTDHRATLAALGATFAALDRARNEALAELGEALKAADGEVNVKEMAELAGLTRKTVYRLIGRTNVK